MFDKIRGENDLKSLYRGCWLIKYPLIEQVLDEIDLSDERLFSLFEISRIEDSTSTVYLRNLDFHPHHVHGSGADANGDGQVNNTIEKTKHDLIREGVWWYRYEKPAARQK